MKWKSFAAVLFTSVLASPACCSAHAAPKDLTLAEIIRVQPLEQVVRTVGTVEDIYQDDVDPRYWMMCLKDGDETVLATVPIEGLDTPDSFSGRRLRITGLCTNKERTERRLPWLRIHLASIAAVEMLEPSTGDIFDTYVYRVGILQAQYSITTAVGLFQSVIGLVLVVFFNFVKNKAN